MQAGSDRFHSWLRKTLSWPPVEATANRAALSCCVAICQPPQRRLTNCRLSRCTIPLRADRHNMLQVRVIDENATVWADAVQFELGDEPSPFED